MKLTTSSVSHHTSPLCKKKKKNEPHMNPSRNFPRKSRIFGRVCVATASVETRHIKNRKSGLDQHPWFFCACHYLVYKASATPSPPAHHFRRCQLRARTSASRSGAYTSSRMQPTHSCDPSNIPRRSVLGASSQCLPCGRR